MLFLPQRPQLAETAKCRSKAAACGCMASFCAVLRSSTLTTLASGKPSASVSSVERENGFGMGNDALGVEEAHC